MPFSLKHTHIETIYSSENKSIFIRKNLSEFSNEREKQTQLYFFLITRKNKLQNLKLSNHPPTL